MYSNPVRDPRLDNGYAATSSKDLPMPQPDTVPAIPYRLSELEKAIYVLSETLHHLHNRLSAVMRPPAKSIQADNGKYPSTCPLADGLGVSVEQINSLSQLVHDIHDALEL